jgi:hypothetical protein
VSLVDVRLNGNSVAQYEEKKTRGKYQDFVPEHAQQFEDYETDMIVVRLSQDM